MKALVLDSLDEMLHGKTIYLIAVITAIMALIVLFFASLDIHIKMRNLTIEDVTNFIGNPLLYSICLFTSLLIALSVIATAGHFPSILQKSSVEFYFSKPLSKGQLVIGKTAGIIFSYGGYIVLAALLIISIAFIKFDFFEWRALYILLFPILSLFIWLSITVFIGVIFRSAVFSIMAVFITWILQNFLSLFHSMEHASARSTFEEVLMVLYYILPKTSETSGIIFDLVLNKPIENWFPLYSSLLFALALFYLSIFILKSKDY